MKKLVLTNIFILAILFSVAQQKKNNSPSRNGINEAATITLTTIGSTTYDLESYGSVRRQIYFYPNGSIGAVFNYSPGFIIDSVQTAYNFFNSSAWTGQTSTILIPPFGNIDRLSNGTEVILSYDSSSASGLRMDSSAIAGSSTWAGMLLPPEPNGHQCGWPHMAIGGTNGMTVHVISLTEPVASGGFLYNGIDGMLTYSRSEDGGATWNIIHSTLPGWNSSVTARMYPDQYAIDAKGSIIAITAGGKTNDWILWKSVDNGTTWTVTSIKSFPIPAYDEFTMTTDTNSDGTADTLLVPDGSMAILIDLNGIVHCWSGDVGIVDHTAAAGFEYAYHYSKGLNYWNESMGSLPPVVITPPISISNDIAKYGDGVCSMPSAGVDANNIIYVCFSGIVEGTSNGGNPDQSYRNISAMLTDNSGVTWSNPGFLSPDNFDEQVFPSMARDVNNTVKIIFQQDPEPGMAAWGDLDPVAANDIDYLEESTVILTGIDSPNGIENEIKISPNPFTSSLSITLQNQNIKQANISIKNILGQTIFSKELPPPASDLLLPIPDLTTKLDLSFLSRGIYLLEVNTGEERMVRKVVKE